MHKRPLTAKQYRRQVFWSQVLYWAFIGFLLAPACFLFLAGLNWTFGQLSATAAAYDPAAERQRIIAALPLALPGIGLELLLFWAWVSWRNTGGKSNDPGMVDGV